MRRKLWTLLWALVAFTSLASAQDRMAEYSREFQRGIEALTAGRHAEGIRAFERCLEIVPKDPVSAYNIACGHALMAKPDQAFEWLEKSAAWGFGNIDGQIEHAQKDEDLASLRGDERFGRYIERMRALREKVRAFSKEAAIHVPAALADAAEVGVLVVLHAPGKTKQDVVQGPWRGVAEELGLVLIAPSGLHAVEGEPEDGMAFFRDVNAYAQRPWIDEKPIVDAVTAFQKSRKVDKSRVLLAGEAQSAPVAFNAAVSSPGLFRGVIAYGPILPQLSAPKAPNAGTMGLAAQVVLHPGEEPLDAGELEKLAKGLREQLAKWNVRGDVTVVPATEPDPTTSKDALVAVARKLLASMEPAKVRRHED